jgi:hypothetical protein
VVLALAYEQRGRARVGHGLHAWQDALVHPRGAWRCGHRAGTVLAEGADQRFPDFVRTHLQMRRLITRCTAGARNGVTA